MLLTQGVNMNTVAMVRFYHVACCTRKTIKSGFLGDVNNQGLSALSKQFCVIYEPRELQNVKFRVIVWNGG